MAAATPLHERLYCALVLSSPGADTLPSRASGVPYHTLSAQQRAIEACLLSLAHGIPRRRQLEHPRPLGTCTHMWEESRALHVTLKGGGASTASHRRSSSLGQGANPRLPDTDFLVIHVSSPPSLPRDSTLRCKLNTRVKWQSSDRPAHAIGQ